MFWRGLSRHRARTAFYYSTDRQYSKELIGHDIDNNSTTHNAMPPKEENQKGKSGISLVVMKKVIEDQCGSQLVGLPTSVMVDSLDASRHKRNIEHA